MAAHTEGKCTAILWCRTSVSVLGVQVYVQPLLHDSTSRNPTLGRVCLLSSADKLTSMSVFLHSVEHLYTLNTQLLASLADKVGARTPTTLHHLPMP